MKCPFSGDVGIDPLDGVTQNTVDTPKVGGGDTNSTSNAARHSPNQKEIALNQNRNADLFLVHLWVKLVSWQASVSV